MKPIISCSIENCGLRFGYELAVGSEICWLHAEKAKLPPHLQWRRAYNEFTKDFLYHFGPANTKRDSYGMKGFTTPVVVLE